MDATLNDFLNEINEIAPPKETKKKKNDCAWQECFDDTSGFPYYWNMGSNEVTWQMPDEYKNWLEKTKKPATAPLFPVVKNEVKIYKIQEETNRIPNTIGRKNTRPPKIRRKSDSEDDEKITLISSYGGDTESETEEDVTSGQVDLAADVQTTESNGNLSPKIISKPNSEDETSQDVKSPASQAPADLLKSSAFALVAGYGEDSEEEEEIEKCLTPPPPIVAHSTLFPIAAPIDINQFIEPKPVDKIEEVVDVDTKAFKRKRRIGIDLINVPRKPRVEDVEHKTLGFDKEKYNNFKSGGVAFVKSDTLNPVIEMNGNVEDDTIENSQVTLKEKLLFLSEGREAVSPVQIMLIQLETLYTALREGSLRSTYITRWIKDMCEELIKLEEDAAPSGWLLQWDRSQKRYYYKSKSTDDCQWDYPLVVEDDAMDICTTPPPQEEIQDVEEVVVDKKPPSPVINSDSLEPPPPPIISTFAAAQSAPSNSTIIKVEPPPPPNISQFTVGQPLPPGVDPPEPQTIAIPIPPPPTNDLSSALDSFYSDIAAIESTKPLPIETMATKDTIPTPQDTTLLLEPVKKKKRVKMAQGISMKKKGVSKLVEKWKNVQKDLD